jgi:PiT family inorganic phosphate transporter
MDLVIIILVILFALAFSVANGRSDAANAIATVVSTRVLSPLTAVVFGAIFNLVGAMCSDKVANTIGNKIAHTSIEHPLPMVVFLAAVVVAPIWITVCTMRGLPISCSHSLLGGLIGAVLAAVGDFSLAWQELGLHHYGEAFAALGLKGGGIWMIVIGAFIGPIAGFALGYVVILAVAWIFRRMRPAKASWIFGKLQILSAGAMAFAHGTGDAQKAMGLICGALLASQTAGQHTLDWLMPAGGMLSPAVEGQAPHMVVPVWTRLLCALTMAAGTALGGWAVIRTLGSRLAHLKPFQGFCAETGASVTIMVSTLLEGIPVSTTHSITGSIMGVGAAKGARAVKWGVGKKIVFAWVFTFPVCIIGGWLLYMLFRLCGLG